MEQVNLNQLSVPITPLMNSVSNNLLSSIAVNRNHITNNPYLFNNQVTPSLPITNQRSSGRCWLFATMNLIRVMAHQNFVSNFQTEVDKLEFSQSYVYFWDKFHRYQMNLKYYIEMLEEKNSKEYLRTFFNDPMGDGGQWDMAKAVVKRYGIVPRDIFPDSFHAKNSRGMNYILTNQLKNDCLELKNVGAESRNQLLKNMMKRVYRMLVSFLGEPPKPNDSFSWTFEAKVGGKKKVVTWNTTPLGLLERTKFNPDDYVSVIHDPRTENPYNNKYVIKYLGNLENRGVGWINLSIDRLKQLTAESIRQNVPVWFGCDVGNNWDRDSGVHHPGIQDFKGVVGLNTDVLTKENRLRTFASLPNHAMVINGFFEDDDKIIKRWKIENSWGTKSGHQGHLLMTDKWFNEYVFQIVVKKSLLSNKERGVLEMEPRIIQPWDPLGTLA